MGRMVAIFSGVLSDELDRIQIDKLETGHMLYKGWLKGELTIGRGVQGERVGGRLEIAHVVGCVFGHGLGHSVVRQLNPQRIDNRHRYPRLAVDTYRLPQPQLGEQSKAGAPGWLLGIAQRACYERRARGYIVDGKAHLLLITGNRAVGQPRIQAQLFTIVGHHTRCIVPKAVAEHLHLGSSQHHGEQTERMGCDIAHGPARHKDRELQFVVWPQAGIGEVTDPDTQQCTPSDGLDGNEILCLEQPLHRGPIGGATNQRAVAVVNVIGRRRCAGGQRGRAIERVGLKKWIFLRVHAGFLWLGEDGYKR